MRTSILTTNQIEQCARKIVRGDTPLFLKLIAISSVCALGAGCTQANFAGATSAATSPLPVSNPSTPTDSGVLPTSSTTPNVLTANALTYVVTVGVALNIAKSDIYQSVKIPSGDTLVQVSVSQPTDGSTLTDAGQNYVFEAMSVGARVLNYTVVDKTGVSTGSQLTVTVVPSGSAIASFYACGNGQLFELSANNQSVLSTVNTTYLGKKIEFNDMAIGSNGTIYAKDLSNGIYQLNAVTGVATQIVAVFPGSIGYLEGMTFLPNGNLATVQSDGSILEMNLTTLQGSVFVKSSYTMLGGDLKYLPDGFAYWTVANSSSQLCQNYTGAGTQTLVQINPRSGQMTEIGCLDQANIFGLGFAHGIIYGFTGTGNVLQIDTSTAKTTVITAPGFQFWGAASNPILW